MLSPSVGFLVGMKLSDEAWFSGPESSPQGPPATESSSLQDAWGFPQLCPDHCIAYFPAILQTYPLIRKMALFKSLCHPQH